MNLFKIISLSVYVSAQDCNAECKYCHDMCEKAFCYDPCEGGSPYPGMPCILYCGDLADQCKAQCPSN